jgi:hypothetical protein
MMMIGTLHKQQLLPDLVVHQAEMLPKRGLNQIRHIEYLRLRNLSWEDIPCGKISLT